MSMFFGVCAFLATGLGGLFALRFKDKLHLVLGFSAGAVIAVAFFDLLPEAINLGAGSVDSSVILSLAALGFFTFMVLDRFVFFHGCHSEAHHHDHTHVHASRGKLGAGTLSLHSFFDGLAIGLSFQVSLSVGAVVAAAVLVHDFSDGINTVNVVLKNNGQKKDAQIWLFLDALMPIIGVIIARFLPLPETALACILGLFAGFFLYIGASDLLPESHHSHPTVWTTIATCIGAAILYIAIRSAGL